MKTDANRGITNIVYNYLGLQERIEFGENKRIENVYDAEGLKLIQRLVNGSTIIQTDYTGDLIYRNDTLISIAHDEGISRPLDAANSGFAPHFFYTDHLGNTRLIYSVAPNGAYMVQENHYGPFGELLEGLGQSGDWKFLYQGKEFIDGLGYDFHARNYDVWRGQFDGVDAVDHFGLGGYAGMGNNPTNIIDPDGKTPLLAAAIGGIIGGIGYTLNAAFSTGGLSSNWRFGQFAASVGIGAASGLFSFGIGEAAAGMSGLGKIAFQTGMHGYVGGFSSVAQGGSFGSGFATGAAGSLVGSATANFHPAIQIGSAAIFSGGVAELSGGSFWQGAAQGGITAGLNHGLHDIYEKYSWDLNHDGILQKKEADSWWLNGEGRSIGVDNRKIDWTGLEIPENLADGNLFSINTTDAFIKLPYETASTYGGTSFKLIKRQSSLIRVIDQDYHYNMRPQNNTENISRNILTRLGMPKGNGITFKIHYLNSRFKLP